MKALELGVIRVIFVGPGKAIFLLWILLLSFFGIGSQGSFYASNLDEGLVGWWKFDEGTGATALDSSGFGNVGAIRGATYVSGIDQTGLAFDGTNDFVEIPHSISLDITGPLTIEAWIFPIQDTKQTGIVTKQVKHDSLGGWPTYYKFLLQQKGDPSGLETKEFSLWLSDGSCPSVPRCVTFDEPAGELHTHGGSVRVNSWQHIVGMYDGANSMIYLNGQLVADSKFAHGGSQIQVATQLNPEAYPVFIGLDRRAYFKGVIDEVRLYNRALSASEVVARCNLTKPAEIICG